MTVAISKVIAPPFKSPTLLLESSANSQKLLHSILNGPLSTERFVSLLGGEAFPEYSDDLINAVILETEEAYQGLPDIEDII